MKNVLLFTRLAALIALQWLLVEGLPLTQYGNPYAYLLFLIWLPVNSSKTTLLLWAFLAGSIMDSLEQSGGAHTLASLGLILIKPPIERGLLGFLRDTDAEKMSGLSLRKFIIPATLFTLVHHALLFTLENYGFSPWPPLLLRISISSIFTLLIIISLHLLLSSRNE